MGHVADNHFGTLITHSTITGEWPTLEQLHDKLRPLSRGDAILRIAWINAFTRTWAITRTNDLDKRARDYVLPSWNDRFTTWTANFGEGFVFSRYTLLWLLRQAITACSPNGTPIDTRQALQTLGEACLMANDLASLPAHMTTGLAVAANLLPNIDYMSHEDYDRELARTRYLLNDLAPRSSEPRLQAVAIRLSELLEHNIDDYCDLAFGCAMRPICPGVGDMAGFLIPSLKAEWYTNTSVAPNYAAAFLESVSYTEDEFAQSTARSTSHPADLTIFRDRPLLKKGEDFVPLDAGFLLDKAGRSLFWTALKRAKDAERESLLERWGELFEIYINSLLAESHHPETQLIAGPCFGDGAQAFDACILEGTTLIVMEHKASTIANAVKYANNPSGLNQVLEERFVTGGKSGRKGLAQLARAIQRFATGDDLIDQETGRTITAKNVSKIIPVLVHLDNALRVPGMNLHLSERLKNFGRVRRIILTPLVLLPVTELEELQGHLQTMQMSAFLESFLNSFKADRAAVFFAKALPVLHGQHRAIGPTLVRFDAYLSGLEKRLFPEEAGG